MTDHQFTVDTRDVRQITGRVTLLIREYRWLCSCGDPGPWFRTVLPARNGGNRHVAAHAAQEQGK